MLLVTVTEERVEKHLADLRAFSRKEMAVVLTFQPVDQHLGAA